MTLGRALKGSLIVLATLAFLLQMVIEPSADNIASACVVYASSMMVLLYFTWSRALDTQPLSSFVVLGFCMTTQLGALIVQTVFWTPLIFSLYDPLYTFGTLAIYQAIAVIVHAICGYFSSAPNSRDSIFRSMLRRIGIYRSPSAATLWLMGFIGLIGFIASASLIEPGGQATGSTVIGKVAESFLFLTWAPFLVPFYSNPKGTERQSSRRMTLLLILYALLIALVGIARNARGMVFVGAVTVALLYFLHCIRSTQPLTGSGFRKGVLIVLGASLLMQPLSYFVTAMAIARASRTKLSSVEMIEKTIDVLKRPSLIEAVSAREPPTLNTAYDERYIAHPMLARLVETKFHDNALHFARGIVTEENRSRLWEMTGDSFLAALPNPVLKVIGINLNKAELSFSVGDYLAYLSKGGRLGGFRTGSLLAQGIVLCGYMFPFVFAFECLIIFQLLALLTSRTSVGVASSVTALGMMNIWPLFQHAIVTDALGHVFDFIVRGFAQMTLEYALVLAIAHVLFGEKYVERE